MLGRHLRLGVALVVVAALGTGGLYASGVVGVPDAGVQDNSWGEVSDDRIEVVTTVWIDNPNPFGIEAGDVAVDYAVALNEVQLAEGDADDVALPRGNATQTLRTDLRYQDLPEWWASHIRNDEVSRMAVTADVHADVGPVSTSPTVTHEDELETDLERVIGEAMSELEGEYRGGETGVDGGATVEPRVVIEDTDVEWGEVTEEETELRTTVAVHNPNAYPIPTPAFTGEMEFNDVGVAEWEAHEVDVVAGPEEAMIPPGATEEITFVVYLDNEQVADWFASHVENDEFTDATIRAQLALSVAGSQVTMPRDGEALRCEYDVYTSVFVDQDAGAERRECVLAPWETTREDLEAAGATFDLSQYETDWQDEGTGGDDLFGDGNESADGSGERTSDEDGSGDDGGEDDSLEDDLLSRAR